jgi:hypothetical protein
MAGAAMSCPNRRPPDHVIVYLPELDVRRPTAQFAPFGVLGNLEYDKTAVRVSGGMAQRASGSIPEFTSLAKDDPRFECIKQRSDE